MFNPTEIAVDYKAAIHLAIKQHWVFAEITGYRFHLAQEWFKKISELGKDTIILTNFVYKWIII